MTDAKWDGEIRAAMKTVRPDAEAIIDEDRAIARHFFAKGLEEAASKIASHTVMADHELSEEYKAGYRDAASAALHAIRAIGGGGNEDG